MITIRQLTRADRDKVVQIADNLPEWFDKDARSRAIPTDVKHQDGFIAFDGEIAIDFVSYFIAEGRLNIGWLGVKKEYQRKGIGYAFLNELEKESRILGISEIATYTMGDTVDYPPYEQTRKFYFKNGFVVYQWSKTDNPGCPEEIRIKKRVVL